MDYITARQAAEKWGVSMRWVQAMLKAGRIEGAVKPSRDWLIPASAERPADPRRERLEHGEPYHINKKAAKQKIPAEEQAGDGKHIEHKKKGGGDK